ncbi:nucleoporin Nup43-like [Octopus sinensis]|uniref:Nucleoporin Nup43-like n=1 Tax=Octopus sinensis TaxID=2607531 RepID=A0A6P7TTG4_9MOLL|nr:nucleoporin Nup43-like [Octopus sinensis]
MADMNVKFISQKISKIRWKPVGASSLQKPNLFVTGSWDDEQSKLSFWTFGQHDIDYDLYTMDTETAAVDMEPQLLADITHVGDVTDLKYLDQQQVVASSSKGSVGIFKHNQNTQAVECVQTWKNLHGYNLISCPCTCVGHREDVLVTGGEDGKICVLNLEKKNITKCIDKADSCTINSITFLRQNEILITNSTGQLKIFDLRANPSETPQTLFLSGEQVSLMCAAKHPSQQHLVATGTVDGSLCLWDLRQKTNPVTLLGGHTGPLWEVKFHSAYPNHLFTCSEDGSLWHWDNSTAASSFPYLSSPSVKPSLGGTSRKTMDIGNSGLLGSVTNNPWSLNASDRHKIEITSLLEGGSHCLSINSLDVEEETILCGGDNESIYTIPLPNLR